MIVIFKIAEIELLQSVIRYLILAVMALGLSLLTGAGAEAREVDSTHRITISSGSEVDYPPFCFVDANGNAAGFSVELLRAALAAMNRDVIYRTGPWPEVRRWLENGEIQALPLVGRTPEREPLFDFTFPYMSLYGAIVVREDTDGIQNLGDLAGKSVAVMKGDNADEFLRREERGIEIHTTETFEDALRELSEGRYDAVVIQRLVGIRLLQEIGLTNLRIVKNPIEGFRQDFCFAVREGDRDTLALLNEGLALVMADETYRHLHSKWFASLELPTDRPIVVGGDHNYPPYEYLDEKGRPQGFTVELTRAIAKEMGLAIEIRLGPWSQIVKKLKTGEIDVIEGMFYSTERDQEFDFSPPYLVNHYVTVLRQGKGEPPVNLDQLADYTIVMQRGDLFYDFLSKKGFGGRISLVDAQEDVLKGVAEGKYDCGIVIRISALYMIEQNGFTNLSLGQGPLYTADYCYAVGDNRQALLTQFSEGLKVLDENGEYHRIYEKYMAVYDDSSPNWSRILKHVALGALPVLIVTLLIFIWSWSLRKQVERKTEQLRDSEQFQRAIIACSPVALYSIDPDGKVLTWNSSAEKVLGWKADDVIGEPLPIVPKDKQDEFLGLWNQILRGGSFTGLEVVSLKKDGSLFSASLSAAPIYDAGQNLFGIMTAIEDISDKKRTVEKLRESEERYRLIAENTLDVIWTMNLDLEYTYVNQAIFSLSGYTPEEWLGSSLSEHCDQENFDKIAKIIEEEMAKGSDARGIIFQTVMLNKNGDSINVEVHGKLIYDDDGHPISLQGITRDITERVQSQQALLRSEVLLNAAQHIGKVGGWEWDMERQEMYWTDETYRIHDMDPGEDLSSCQDHITRSLECYSETDRPQIFALFNRCIDQGEPYEIECRFITTKGRNLWIRTAGQAVIENGRIVKIFGNIQDITKQKKAEDAQRYKDELLLEIGSLAKIGGWEFDPTTRQGTWTDEVARIHEVDLQQAFSQETGLSFYQGEYRAKIEEAIDEAVNKAKPYDLVLELRTAKGNIKWVRTIGHPKFEGGKVSQIRGSFQDITEIKQVQAELEHSNFMLSRLLNVARDLNEALDFTGAVQIIRKAARDLSGADGVSIVVREDNQCHYIDEDAIEPLWKGKRFPLEACISGWAMLNRQSVAIEDIYTDSRIPHEAYRPTFVKSLAIVPIRTENPLGAIGAYWARDHLATKEEMELLNALGNMLATIWDAVKTREALRRSEKTLSTIFDHMLDGVLMLEVEIEKFVVANSAICESLGYTHDELLSLGIKDIHDEKDLSNVEATFARQFRGEITLARNMPVKRKDGTIFFADVNATPLELDGRLHMLGIFRDITDRKLAEDRIEHLNRVLLAIREVNQLIVRGRDELALIREGCRVLVVNRGYASALIVLIDEEKVPLHWAESGLGAASEPIDRMLKRGVLPPCFNHVQETGEVLLVEEPKVFCEECPILAVPAKSQSMCVALVHESTCFGYLAVSAESHFLVNDEEKNLFYEMASDFAYALHILKMDKIREETEKERNSLEGQLLQAQKMESVGRLAGGVAHDFNNMLTVIIGNAELAQSRLEPDNPLYKTFEEILNAGERSTDLTRQLLAFARKQVIQPVVLDLNASVEGMLKMLRRLLGEEIDILWKPSPNLWVVKIDPAQVDQIMVNLCVNARDAISGHGKVTLETENIVFDNEYCDKHSGFHPGEFVMLAISDDGMGMDREIINKVFEPFFTTKKEGKGTGLGLSTVYGIVKQNEGFINVYSEPNQGTTFKIYFARHEGQIASTSVNMVPEAQKGRGETILLVEDEPTILDIGTKMLEKLGYTVLTSNKPNEALRIAREYGDEIALLLTDVVMPEMNGRELANLINEVRPGVKCLFMSGYTANVIAHRGVIDEDIHFLPKPLSLLVVAKKVREVLDS